MTENLIGFKVYDCAAKNKQTNKQTNKKLKPTIRFEMHITYFSHYFASQEENSFVKYKVMYS